MEPRKLGSVLGPLLDAYVYAAGRSPRAQKAIEQGVTALLQNIEPAKLTLKEFYSEFIEGLMVSHTPLQRIPLIADKLLGSPKVREDNVAPMGRQVFIVRNREGRIMKVIFGDDENGRILVEAMIEAVRRRGQTNREEQNPANPKPENKPLPQTEA